MHHRTDFPYRTFQEDVRVPMPDGTLLYARIWRPHTEELVPALLEYLPYRLGDWTAPRDAQRHPYYAGHGYASVRVDLRGSGNSEGVMTDEYSEREIDDGVAVVEWLAAQPWCSGRVGMFGISWGGFNSLQIAARRPEPLKAVVTCCSADDRYDNDVHYIGGSVLGVDMGTWAATMLAFTCRPPDPAAVGEQWREQWLHRLDQLDPFIHTWLNHQTRDAYWQHGSVCEDYSAVDAAVLAVGGWADPYRDTVLRLLEHLPGPARGILGPWSHQYPDRGLPPGPAIGFLQETLRWWDQWLKDTDTGVLDEPTLRGWINESVQPATVYQRRPGRWVGEPSWPSPNVSDTAWSLAGELTGPPVGATDQDALVPVVSPQHTGVDAGRYFPFGNDTDLPPDQRAEDGRSVCFDSEPLEDRVEILGRATARLRLRCDGERGQVIARICDVAEDGSSTLVTRGVLNLSSRHGRDQVAEWTPGMVEEVSFPLNAVGHAFAPGHRVRIALSSAYWPWVWPQAGDTGLAVDPTASSVDLPMRSPAADERVDPVRFEEPEQAEPLPVTVDPADPDTAARERVVTQDVGSGEWFLDVDPGYGGSRVFPDGLRYDETTREGYAIRSDDPLSARTHSHWTIRLRRPDRDWDVRVTTRSEITADADTFVTVNHVLAEENEEPVFERTWQRRIPRTAG